MKSKLELLNKIGINTMALFDQEDDEQSEFSKDDEQNESSKDDEQNESNREDNDFTYEQKNQEYENKMLKKRKYKCNFQETSKKSISNKNEIVCLQLFIIKIANQVASTYKSLNSNQLPFSYVNRSLLRYIINRQINMTVQFDNNPNNEMVLISKLIDKTNCVMERKFLSLPQINELPQIYVVKCVQNQIFAKILQFTEYNTSEFIAFNWNNRKFSVILDYISNSFQDVNHVEKRKDENNKMNVIILIKLLWNYLDIFTIETKHFQHRKQCIKAIVDLERFIKDELSVFDCSDLSHFFLKRLCFLNSQEQLCKNVEEYKNVVEYKNAISKVLQFAPMKDPPSFFSTTLKTLDKDELEEMKDNCIYCMTEYSSLHFILLRLFETVEICQSIKIDISLTQFSYDIQNHIIHNFKLLYFDAVAIRSQLEILLRKHEHRKERNTKEIQQQEQKITTLQELFQCYKEILHSTESFFYHFCR